MPTDTSYSAYDLEVLSLLRHATSEERRALATLMAHNFPAPVDENEQDPEKLLAGLHKKGDGDYGHILRDIAKKVGINCMRDSATQTKTMLPAAVIEEKIFQARWQAMAALLGANLLYGDAAVNAGIVVVGGVAARMAAGNLLSGVTLPAVAGPVGLVGVAALSAYQVYDILARPAFKVTVPAARQIQRLRDRLANPAVKPVSPLADI